MRYLKGTSTHGIFIKKLYSVRPQPRLKVYSDASWADSEPDAKSKTVLLTINGVPISWYSKKQSVVASSTMESEYIAGATGVSECLWVKDLLSELNLPPVARRAEWYTRGSESREAPVLGYVR